jgi:hypothetical protein
MDRCQLRAPGDDARSFSQSFHLALLGPTGAIWLDDPPDLTCKDSTRQHPVDDPLLSCKRLQWWTYQVEIE